MDVSMSTRNFLESVEEYAHHNIRPFASDFEEKEIFPRGIIQDLADLKVLGATFPVEYGGLNLDPLTYGLLTEIIGKADSTVRSLLTVHTSLVGSALTRFGSKEQKNKWLIPMSEGKLIGAFALTEPDIGTDAASIKTNYIEKGATIIINGRKKWITFSGISDLLLVIACNDKKCNAFIVNSKTPGITFTPIKGLLAAKAAHICELEMKNVEIPKENRLGPDGSGFSYIVSNSLDHGRFSIAWGGLAIAQEALNAMVKYSRERIQFGKKIYTFQHIQAFIAEAVVKIHSARALCEKVSFMRNKVHTDSINETIIAKYITSKIAMQIAIDSVQVHGGNGCCNTYPVERLFREAKILEIVEGTSQVLQNVISHYGLRKYYKLEPCGINKIKI
jgi:alkylation response protein AidB-like acyl-CoA dehydrogenase